MFEGRTIQAEEDALFERWRAGRASFSPDGVVDEERYRASTMRTVFLLKEVNDRQQTNFDLRAFLRRGGRRSTWDMVTRWVAAIRALEDDPAKPLVWARFADVDEAARKQHLTTIAAVNLKKSAGGHTTDNDALEAAATSDARFLDEQLSLYDPNIVVCCGSSVASLTKHVGCLARGEWSQTTRGVWVRRLAPQTVLYSVCHPAARGADNMKFYLLADALRETWPTRSQ